MSIAHLISVVVLSAAGLGSLQSAAPSVVQQTPEASANAALADFNRRVAEYAALHRRLEGPIPTLRISDHPDEIRAAMDALAERIRYERARAKQGDVFTRDITPVFRSLIRAGFAGSMTDLLAIVEEETSHRVTPPRINARWPEGAAFSLVPPGILCALPALPEELEYRFISRHLILWDMHADLIVDVLPNAIRDDT
jgi:hypothetical protein